MVSSISSNTISSWANSLFSKLDTKNQGYIEKSDLESAFSSIAKSTGTTDDTDVDALFNQLDSDSDGKVTESELSTAMSKVADQLDTQYYQTRMQGAMPPPSNNDSSSASSTSSSSDSTYIEAADTNGDGEVSTAELAAYYASESGSASSSEGDLATRTSAMRSMPPPPSDIQSADSAGFTKDELTGQLEEIGSTDSKRSELISGIVQNFDKADTDGDGKVSMDEARTYEKSNSASGSASTASNVSSSSTDASAHQAEMTILKLMQAYGVGQDASASSTSTRLSAMA